MSKDKNMIVTTMFVDIEDSTGISNYLEKNTYEQFLLSFHKTIRNVLKSDQWKAILSDINHKFMGDEFIAFFPHDEYGEKALELALRLSAILKYEWYLSKYNQSRLGGDKEHIELNIGINTGDLSLMEYPVLSKDGKKKYYSYEGFPITLAKRIQSAAEDSGGSRIIVTDRFYREFSRVTHRNYEFHYIGQKSFKGIAQRFSCYEWLGSNFNTFLNFKENKDRNVEETLKALYDKNPHNPWYATILAHFYFYLGEKEYYRGNYDNEFYKKCAKNCIDAIHRISSVARYNLRELNELLFVCLETGETWDELCYRTEQAFTSDQTFSSALALNAKSLYMLGSSLTGKSDEISKEMSKKNIDKAKDAAERLNTLFQNSLDYESLYNANFVLARYYSKDSLNRNKMMKHFRAAVNYAQKGEMDWAHVDYEAYQSDFDNVKHDPELKKEVTKLKKMWDASK